MKARSISYRLLLKLSLPIGLVICWAIYQLSLKRTINSYHVYMSLGDAGELGEGLSISPAYSADRNLVIRKFYQRYQVDTISWKNTLWNHCATLSQRFGCAVDAFPEWTHEDFGKTSALKQEVIFSGSFHDLLQLQHALDNLPAIGLTAGVDYSYQPRNGRTTLRIQLIGLDKHQYL